MSRYGGNKERYFCISGSIFSISLSFKVQQDESSNNRLVISFVMTSLCFEKKLFLQTLISAINAKWQLFLNGLFKAQSRLE